MNETDNLPESIRELTAGKAFTVNDVGMSDAKVIVFDDCVLKVAPFDKQILVIQNLRLFEREDLKTLKISFSGSRIIGRILSLSFHMVISACLIYSLKMEK